MSYYCSAMKHQLMIDVKQKNNARYAPCCHFKKSLDINTFSVETKKYDNLLEQGVRIPECVHCWEVEDKGLRSVRLAGKNLFQKGLEPAIRRLDIRIHNKCNLACTMCYSGASNLWGKLEGKDTFYKINDDELSIIKEKSRNVTQISFQGGEPFYGNEYDEFLMSLDNLENIDVDIFTNVISVKRDVLERWNSKLKSLKINASVDGYGDVYESIRWPTTWSKFEKNAKMIYNIVGRDMSYFWAMQAENASNLFKFLEWRDKFTPNSAVELSLLMGSVELGVETIDEDEKNNFISSYNNYISLKDKSYPTGIFQSEYEQLRAMYKMIKNIQVKDELISKRKDKLKYIVELRNNYKK